MTTIAAPRESLDQLIARIAPLDDAAMALAADRLDHLTKPKGSLGRLETLAIQLAGIRGRLAGVERSAIVVFAADHGVVAQGVSAYPSAVTREMVANYAAGGAAINVLARASESALIVVDVGIAGAALDAVPAADTGDHGRAAQVLARRIRPGSRDFSVEPALTRDETLAAIDAGRRTIDELVADGVDVVGVGEMGIGNTTSASALVAALVGRPADAVTGPGTGLDDDGIRHKVALIDAAIARHAPDRDDALGVLATLGGLEIAALVGAILAAAAARVPVVLDGFITGSAALVAARLAPAVVPRLIPAHESPEPGHRIVLDELGLEPLLALGLRLGEGSGAALGLPIVRAAGDVVVKMATFDEAGVSGRT